MMCPTKLRSSLFAILLICVFCTRARAEEPARDWSDYPMQAGQFDGSWETLEQYEYPEWFRDAKFGIWAIIGPQCVPMQGDWYARHMYVQGHPQYEYHVKTYGHPSKFGYKDLIERFNPEKLDFDKLVGWYKEAGAKYAVILAVHHDNFDLWNSKHHEWNSVLKQPHRDLVGEFRDATKKHGLRFGATTHLARTYSWLQTSHGADKEGPLAGVPYDGADPKWQSLYHPPFPESPRYPQNPPETWKLEWYLRVKDLIDQYQPDLMYFDGGYPFDEGQVGKRVVSHYYNINATWHGGRNEAAMCIKKWGPGTAHGVFRDGTCVQDIERGGAGELQELPWQTDTCIGGWYYRTGTKYKTPEHVAHMLIDIVSKNGNLLLNLPLHPEGTLDADEIAFLQGMGAWMRVNGEAIYETRPWVVYGEGPKSSGGGAFNEAAKEYSTQDFRFTAKGDARLYAFFMQWPADGKLRIRSLAKTAESSGAIEKVELVGNDGALQFVHDEQGLSVILPDARPCDHAWALRVTGQNLRDFQPGEIVYAIDPDARGNLLLDAELAEIHGPTPRLEKKSNAPKRNIGYWASSEDSLSWLVRIAKPGTYKAVARISSAGRATRFGVRIGEQRLEASSVPTQGWEDFQTVDLGRFKIETPGNYTFAVEPLNAETWNPIGLLDVKLSPADTPD